MRIYAHGTRAILKLTLLIFFSFGLCTGCHRWCTTFGCFFVLLLLPFTFSNVLKQYVNQRQCSCKRPICEMYAFVAFPHLNAVVATNGCVQVFQYGSWVLQFSIKIEHVPRNVYFTVMNSWKKTVATIHCVCCIIVTTWTLKRRLTLRWGNQCETPLARVLVTWRSNQGPFQMCLICIGPVGSPHVCISQETFTMTVSRTIGFLVHIATNHLEWHLVSPILRNPHLSVQHWLRCREVYLSWTTTWGPLRCAGSTNLAGNFLVIQNTRSHVLLPLLVPGVHCLNNLLQARPWWEKSLGHGRATMVEIQDSHKPWHIYTNIVLSLLIMWPL